jgi:hypothetical protein
MRFYSYPPAGVSWDFILKSTKIKYFLEYVDQIQKYCDLNQTKLSAEVEQ